MRIPILDLSVETLSEMLADMGIASYRSKQIIEATLVQNVSSFEAITTLSKKLRSDLSKKFALRTLKKVDGITSEVDKTEKYLWKLSDGYKMESVVIREGKRTTFCISSQVGCALDCKFCATGKMGFLRNLTAGEIVEQVLRMEEETGQRPSNIVYMGMGEPMLNYDNVIKAAQTLTSPQGYGMATRRITISTSGVLPGIHRFTKDKQPYALAISLNSVQDHVRRQIMPITKKYPIEMLLEAARDYCETRKKIITFEYVLIDNYNATEKDARDLVALTHQIPCKINVIPCNSDDPKYLPPSKEKIHAFEQLINQRSRRITIRRRKGWEIQAACGQLYAKNERIKPKKK